MSGSYCCSKKYLVSCEADIKNLQIELEDIKNQEIQNRDYIHNSDLEYRKKAEVYHDEISESNNLLIVKKQAEISLAILRFNKSKREFQKQYSDRVFYIEY